MRARRVLEKITAIDEKTAAALWTCVNRLGELGAAAKDAVPALTDALRDKDVKVRGYAAKALERINGSAPRS